MVSARNSGNPSTFVSGAGDLQTCMNAGSNSVHAAHSRIISPSWSGFIVAFAQAGAAGTSSIGIAKVPKLEGSPNCAPEYSVTILMPYCLPSSSGWPMELVNSAATVPHTAILAS